MGLMQYHKISNKDSEGLPTQYTVDRKLSSVEITLYNTPENSTDVIDYWAITRIDDAGQYTNDVDVSYRYLPALQFGLAYFILMERDTFDANGMNVTMQKRNELKMAYLEALNDAMTEDRERVSFQVTPFGYHRRK
jgi:hypothetical protein